MTNIQTTASPTKPGPTPVQIMEGQKNRLSGLQERRTRAQVKLETESVALEQACAEAVALFGTSDLVEIRQMFKDLSADNERLVREFVADLDSAEQRISDLERQLKL